MIGTYADVVRRDRPLFWWRHGNVAQNILSSGQSTSVLAYATSVASSGGFGIPGANGAGGLGRCQGDQSSPNNDGWVLLPNADFTVTAYIGLELWVYPHTSFTAGRRYGLLYRYNTASSTNYRGMTVSTDGKLECQLNSQAVTSADTLITNQWNHCVVNVPYASAAQCDVWLNGKQTIATASFSATSFWGSASQPFAVGRSNNSTNVYSPPAFLAEAAVYPYRLSGAQVVDHYQAGWRTRTRQSIRTAFAYPFPQTYPSSGLTPITEGLPNKRVLMVSDRPR